jgi:hypothetical protein
MSLIGRLLDLVSPRCSLCNRPAVSFQGTNWGTESSLVSRRYGCDYHTTCIKGWTLLPGAATIREALRVEALNKDNGK